MQLSAQRVCLTLAFLIALCCLVPRVRTAIGNRQWRALNQLARTSYGYEITAWPWPGPRETYAQLDQYRVANRALAKNSPGRVVFFGDSITHQWGTRYTSEFFPGKNYLDRGVNSQTTGPMIWRFHQDVIDLHPAAVVILAGTNDVAFHKPLETYTEKDFETMVKTAQHHGLRAILCSVPPLTALDSRDQAYIDQQVRVLNGWLRRYAATEHLGYVDYYSAFADSSGHMQPSLTYDGTHPNSAGYARMRPLAQQAIDAAKP